MIFVFMYAMRMQIFQINQKFISEQVKFNFTYNMFASTGADGNKGAGGSGLQLENGTWIGVTGDLISGRADVGLVVANTAKRSMTNSIFKYFCSLKLQQNLPSKHFRDTYFSRATCFTIFLSTKCCGLLTLALICAFQFTTLTSRIHFLTLVSN